MNLRNFGQLAVASLGALLLSPLAHAQSGFRDFIVMRDGQLFEDNKPFRFVSFNIPNLTYTEDDMRFDHLSGFRLPTEYEIDDALATIQQMGGRVARAYSMSVRKASDVPGIPRHILGPDALDEQAMVVMDQVLASANRHGVRVIISFIDGNAWWGGIEAFAGFRGKTKEDFFTDPQVKDDYRNLVRRVLSRVNTRTGTRYTDDKAVLAWELGNELKSSKEWVREMAPFVKQLAPKQLLAESYFTDPDNPGVDIVQDHLYEGDPVKMIARIRGSAVRAQGHKAYMVGEFGFISTEGMRAVIDSIVRDPTISGGLIWSLRFHNDDGGYYWHFEPHGGDFFKAYHWPGGTAGEAYDEIRFMRMVRDAAYRIQGSPPPALTAPAAPTALSVTDGGIVNWRGATGAASYDLQRTAQPDGAWETVSRHLTDDAVQYHPLAVDEDVAPGKSYRYRLIAKNDAGASAPSAEFGPVTIRCRTLVDELTNFSRTYQKGGKIEFRSNDAHNYKEDCHRLLGGPGTWITYRVDGRITAARIYTFGEQGEPSLSFHASSADSNSAALDVRTQDFYAGKEKYNFRWPRLYVCDALPAGGSTLTIRFLNDVQISRIEIEYQ